MPERPSLRTLLLRPVPTPILILASATLGLYVAACLYLQPPFDVFGDAPGYLEAMRVWNGWPAPAHFTPNRLLTTFGGVTTVALLAKVTGNYLASWFFINTAYFFGLAFVTYALFRRVTGSATAAVLGALFMVGNYDVLLFGLNYLMDLSGWFFFMLSLLGTFLYMEAHERRWLWMASLAAGIGTLFKEYAFFAFAPLGLYLIYAHLRQPKEFVRSLIPPIVSLLPMAAVHAGIYLIYGYSYLDWYGMNTSTFAWHGWVRDAVRSFLVVWSFLTPLAAIGIMAFVHEMRQDFDAKRVFFVGSLILPALAVLAWPIITERLVFLAVPLVALLAAYGIKRNAAQWPWFGFLWLLYVALSFATNGAILSVLYGRF